MTSCAERPRSRPGAGIAFGLLLLLVPLLGVRTEGAEPASAAAPAEAAPHPPGLDAETDQLVDALDFMPIGSVSTRVVVPEHDATGRLVTRYAMETVHRRERTVLEMERMTISMVQAPPHSDVTVDLPVARFDINTRLLKGEGNVTIRRDDFILRGRRAEFDTRTKTGKLTGDIHMTVWRTASMIGPNEQQSDARTPKHD